jgi:B12-binding domain/radical SAM domain protein
MELRAIALAAPEYPEGSLGSTTLTSSDAPSLYNACRYAAQLAETGRGAWSDSNWVGTRQHRRDSILMMHSFKEGRSEFEQLLSIVKPNLLLIGAMTLCLPGAVESARLARELLGDRVCIVLGGHHATETIYTCGSSVGVAHHPGSPLRLIVDGFIDPVFDFVVAGEGEYIIAALGEALAKLKGPHISPREIWDHSSILTQARGNWILGAVHAGRICVLRSYGLPIDRNILPAPCTIFGIKTSFAVFNGRPTAHIYSDTGHGCIYDCTFCSERRAVNGEPAQLGDASSRLLTQMRATCDVVAADHPACLPAAFIEDSTLLSGSNRQLEHILKSLSNEDLNLRFGAQFTVDQILAKKRIIRDLHSVGLDYLFLGIETFEPTNVGGMSKDIGYKRSSWISRTERALELLAEIGIKFGAALLFGLGETREDRVLLFHNLQRWRQSYGSPEPISMNWAVQHPLKGLDMGAGYTYHKWGIPPGPLLDAFRGFGEASVLYPIVGQKAPECREVLEIQELRADLDAVESIASEDHGEIMDGAKRFEEPA